MPGILKQAFYFLGSMPLTLPSRVHTEYFAGGPTTNDYQYQGEISTRDRFWLYNFSQFIRAGANAMYGLRYPHNLPGLPLTSLQSLAQSNTLGQTKL